MVKGYFDAKVTNPPLLWMSVDSNQFNVKNASSPRPYKRASKTWWEEFVQ